MPAQPPTTLVVAQAWEPQSLNPLLHVDYNAYELDNLVYSMLLQQDSAGRLVPDLATNVPSKANGQISPDGLRITYRLRKNVRWQDGAPLTSADIAFTFRAIMNPRTAVPSRAGYDDIARIETPDAYTVTIVLKHRFSSILTFFLAPGQGYPVLPAHLLAHYRSLDSVAFNSLPIGTGPYRVVRWARGDRLELAANPDYFARAPKIDRIVIQYVPNNATIVNELRTGEATAYFLADPSEISAVAGIASLKVQSHPIGGEQQIFINVQDVLLRNVRLRRAIALSIDVPYIAKAVGYGMYSARAAQRGQFYWAFDPRVPDLAYAPAEADRIFDETNWRRGANGMRSKGKRTLSFDFAYIAGRPADATIALLIQQEAKARGIVVNLRPYRIEQLVAPANLGGPLYSGNFQMVLIDGGFPDPDVSHVYGCAASAPAGYNFSRYCNPELDAALSAASSTFDLTARMAAYSKVQKILMRDLPSIVLWQKHEVDITTSQLIGFNPSISSPFYHAADWKLVSP